MRTGCDRTLPDGRATLLTASGGLFGRAALADGPRSIILRYVYQSIVSHLKAAQEIVDGYGEIDSIGKTVSAGLLDALKTRFLVPEKSIDVTLKECGDPSATPFALTCKSILDGA